jgi:phage host-nuclease inhibitor protein Gam
MARRKPESIHPVPDIQAADVTLAEIAGLRRKLRLLEDELNARVEQAKEEAKARAKPLHSRIEALENGLQAFAEHRKQDLFDEKRSRSLVYGALGFRKSSEIKPVAGGTWKAVLAMVKERGFPEALRLREDVNREELHKWPDDRLALVGARRLAKDIFWYELDEARLESLEEPAHHAAA